MILAPTRELAAQIAKNIEDYTKYVSLNVAAIFGGTKMSSQEKKLEQGLDILVATPGRLLEHMELNNVSLANLEFLVFDEADRMLDMGFISDIRMIMSDIRTHSNNAVFGNLL